MAGAGGQIKALPPSPALTPRLQGGLEDRAQARAKGPPWNSNSGKLNGFMLPQPSAAKANTKQSSALLKARDGRATCHRAALVKTHRTPGSGRGSAS